MNTPLKSILPWLVGAILMSPACYYDVEEELYVDTGCDTDNVTYTETILPILEANCYSCHSESLNTGNVTLEGYSKLKVTVDSGRFLGAIRHESGFAPMPENQPQLASCTIEKIEAWVAAGAPNN